MEHGTRSCYVNAGCRCDPCREASSEFYRARGKEVCSECGGPRSFGSSKRCRDCYRENPNPPRNGKRQWVNSRSIQETESREAGHNPDVTLDGQASEPSYSEIVIQREKEKREAEARITAQLKQQAEDKPEVSNESQFAGLVPVRPGEGSIKRRWSTW